MGRGRNRSGISLRGFQNRTRRLNLTGYKGYERMIINTIYDTSSYADFQNHPQYSTIVRNITNVVQLPPDYMNLKLYLIDKFLIPLADRRFDYVNQNYYNIDWILEELDKLDYPQLEEEIEFFRRVVEVLQFAATTQLTFDDLKAKLYGKRFGITIETSRIVLQAPYEVYVLLFGNPKDKPGQVFEEDRIDRIKELLENSPGILLEDIREKLAFDYYKYYTKYHKEKLREQHPDWELEETENDEDIEKNYKRRIEEFLEEKEQNREIERAETFRQEREEKNNIKMNIKEDDKDHEDDDHDHDDHNH